MQAEDFPKHSRAMIKPNECYIDSKISIEPNTINEQNADDSMDRSFYGNKSYS
jgi:hypothetical protein